MLQQLQGINYLYTQTEPQKYAERKKPDTHRFMLYDFIYMKSEYRQNGGGNNWEGVYGHILG